MKRRSFFSLLITAVVVLLLIGAGGFFWLAAHSPLKVLQGGGRSSPEAAMFVPKQAPLMVSLLVKPDQLEALRLAIAPPGQRRRARAELAQIHQSLLSKTGLAYEQDIQPWLGEEITVAVTTPDIDRDDANGAQPGYLLALETEDPQRAREFLQLFWQKRAIAGVDLVFEQYAGVKLIYGSPIDSLVDAAQSIKPQPLDSPPTLPEASLVTAVVGDRFVLFANHPKVLREAINNVQASGLNLSQSRTYQQALKQLSSRQLGMAFVNLPQLSEWFTQDASAAPAPNRSYEGLLVALQLQRQGILADTAWLAASGQSLSPAKSVLTAPPPVLQWAPATSSVSASGRDLQKLWHQWSDGFAGNPILTALITQPLIDLQTHWGIDLADEIFNWVTDEYMVSLVPQATGTASDWVFAAAKTPTTSEAIAHLDQVAQAQGLSVGPLMLDDQPVLAWTKLSTAPVTPTKSQPQAIALQTEVQGVHATVENYEIFATSVAAMNQALTAKSASLIDSDRYQQAIAPLERPNNGYLYLDWETTRAVLEQRLPLFQVIETIGQPFFDHMRSLTLSSYGNDASISRGAVFIQFKGT